MSQELATTSQQLHPVTVEKLSSYLDSMGLASKLTAQEKTQFIEIAQAFGLNPFIREIYATKYGEGQYAQFSIIVGYEVYIKRAERSGQLAGWKAETFGSVEAGDLRAVVTIYRKDWQYPLVHEVYYSEYVQTTYDKETKSRRPNKMWTEKPITMTKKVGIAQAFRMAFSVETGGMPYTADEMPTLSEQAAEVIQIQADEAKAKQAPRLSKEQQAQAMKDLTEWQNGVDTLPNLAESYSTHLDALRKLKNIGAEEKTDLFNKFKNKAWDKGFDYNEKDKVFYAAEPVQEAEVVE